jgi:hypothetical protein
MLNPWCGICRDRRRTYEDRRSIFETLAEAAPHLQEMAEAQRLTREFLNAQRN